MSTCGAQRLNLFLNVSGTSCFGPSFVLEFKRRAIETLQVIKGRVIKSSLAMCRCKRTRWIAFPAAVFRVAAFAATHHMKMATTREM